MLRTFREGELVTVADEGGGLAGVVAHVPSLVRVDVAVDDAQHGPVFRSVHPKKLTPREQDAPADDALRRLIHRTAGAGRPGTDARSGRGRRAHTRPARHRTTGK